MSMLKLSFVLMLFPLFYIGQATAGNSGQAEIRYFKINDTYLTIYADVDNYFVDDAACQSGTAISEAVVIERTRDDFRELYAAVMLAFGNNHKVAFWLDGSCSGATQGGPFPISTLVYVYKE